MQKRFHEYILASRRNETLYIRVISDLIKRAWQHKNNQLEGFTASTKYRLVHYEEHEDAKQAIQREKQLKRAWKLKLIEKMNPTWRFI